MLITDNRRYVVITTPEEDVLDFSDFLEDSAETLIWKPDQTRSVVKYVGDNTYRFTFPTNGPFTLVELNEWKENNGWPLVDNIDSDEP